MKITIGDLRALSRILQARGKMKLENYHSVKRYEGGEYIIDSKLPHRTFDGTGNDPKTPLIGRVGEPFMRNAPFNSVKSAHASNGPDPRVVSQRLLHNPSSRQILAPRINLLSAAWLQFQVHDWFNHAIDPHSDLSLESTSTLKALRVERTVPLVDPEASDIPIYENTQGHWWDGSQIYGHSKATSDYLRERDEHGELTAKLRLNLDGEEPRLPYEAPTSEHGVNEAQVELSGFIKNWWIGLSGLHTLLAREHNAIVAELRIGDEFPKIPVGGAEEWLYQKARLITGALIAKIQTTEWTTSLLRYQPIQLGLVADWWGIGPDKAGVLLGEVVQATLHLPDNFELNATFIDKLVSEGITTTEIADPLKLLIEKGTFPPRKTPSPKETDLEGGDLVYAMSEEFVAVYRMHALLVDPVPLRTADGKIEELPLADVFSAERSRALGDEYGVGQLLYSLAKASPAALRLNNYPKALTQFRKPGEEGSLDLGAIDVLRDRERGIPRYTEFKRVISKIRGPLPESGPASEFRTFADICGDPNEKGISPEEADRRIRDAELLSQTYTAPDDVDLLIGTLAEPLPPGFSFSWTAFEIFLLMTLLRLSADRFYTTDYTAEVYTVAGIEWINNNSMGTLLTRHYDKELTAHLREGKNPFLIESWR